MSLDINQFKAKLTGGGARPNLFKCIINFPLGAGGNTELASFMIKGAQLPSSVIAPLPVPFRGRVLNLAGDRTFEPWTITVLNDTKMEIRNAFERWMNLMQSHSINTGVQNPLLYQTNLEVQQLDKSNNVTKRYNIIGAFPTNISSIELSSESNDQVEEFTVELTYQYWLSNTTL
jgi:hypothetical protein